MNILLIGGTGNISSGIVKGIQLRFGAKANLTVYNRGKSEDRLPENVTRLHGDRNDFAAFEKQFRGTTWDAVIDMICFRPDQAESVLRTFSNKTPQLIFCSTVCVYGNTQTVLPTTEATVPQPHSAYGKNKLACEQIFLTAARNGAFTRDGGVTVMRPSHTFGPGFNFHGQTGGGGSPGFIDRLRKGLPVVVSGDGNGLWQITSSDNVGLAFALAIGNAHTLNETYNVVSKHTWTWDEVTQRVAAAIGAPPPKIVHIPSDLLVSIDPARYGGLNDIFRYHGVYSNEKLHRDLPAYREITTFEQAVRETVQWLDSQGRLKLAESDPFESKLIERYQAFAQSAKNSLAPAPA
jgi:nucleoside-diphosphate-sugar epimerase